jgi:hypothetical protein
VRDFLARNYMSIEQAVRTHSTLSQALEKAVEDQNANNLQVKDAVTSLNYIKEQMLQKVGQTELVKIHE